MDFQTSIRTCLKEKYFTFKGRASRSEFWFFFLFLSFYYVTTGIILAFLPTSVSFDTIVSDIARLIFLIPQITVTTRRLHDIDDSGWWQLAPGILYSIAMGMGISIHFSNIVLGSCITFIFIFLALKGTKGENKFGPPPFAEVLGN